MRDKDQLILESLYTKIKPFGPIYHISNNIKKFKDFDIAKSQKSSVLGPAIYATFEKSKWNPSHLKNGNVLTGYVKGNIIDLTNPTKDDLKNIETFIGRKLDTIPFISLEKRYGSVSNALKSMGYSAAIHMGPGSTGKHIAVFSSDDIIEI